MTPLYERRSAAAPSELEYEALLRCGTPAPAVQQEAQAHQRRRHRDHTRRFGRQSLQSHAGHNSVDPIVVRNRDRAQAEVSRQIPARLLRPLSPIGIDKPVGARRAVTSGCKLADLGRPELRMTSEFPSKSAK